MLRTGLGMQKSDILIPFSSLSKQGREEIWDLIERIANGEVDEEEVLTTEE